MKSNTLSDNFCAACANGDLATVKRLYEDYEKFQFSVFYSFINLFKPTIDPHYYEDTPLLNACGYKNHSIVEYLLNQKSFTKNLNKNSKLEICLSFIMKSGNLELTKSMLSLIENNHKLNTPIALAFNSACAKGHLNIAKYVLSESEFNWVAYDKKSRAEEDYSLVYSGFIDACKRGQLDIVKYIVESPNIKEKIDFNKFHSTFIVNNIDIIHYFIFDLNIKKDDPFISKLRVSDDNASKMENLFKINETYTDIAHDINSVELPPVKKRMKL